MQLDLKITGWGPGLEDSRTQQKQKIAVNTHTVGILAVAARRRSQERPIQDTAAAAATCSAAVAERRKAVRLI
jgi:hypothetical protein